MRPCLILRADGDAWSGKAEDRYSERGCHVAEATAIALVDDPAILGELLS